MDGARRRPCEKPMGSGCIRCGNATKCATGSASSAVRERRVVRRRNIDELIRGTDWLMDGLRAVPV